MLKLKYLWMVVIAMTFMVSCTKDNLDETTIEKEEIVPFEKSEQNSLLSRTRSGEEDGEIDLLCLTLNFPFELVEEDGSTVVVEGEDAFFTILSDSVNYDIVDFVYPLSVQLDGEEISVTSSEELGELFAECVPDGGWSEDYFPAYLIGEDNSCYDLAYPVSLMRGDGSVINVENEGDFVAAIAEEDLLFVYPLGLVDENGNTVLAENTDELLETLFTCNDISYPSDSTDWEDGFDEILCYTLVFPATVINADGEIVVVNNHEELCAIMITGELANFDFPITLNDGEEDFIVNNQEEFDNALLACLGGSDFRAEFNLLLLGTMPNDSLQIPACYEINFPISLELRVDEDSSEILEIADMETLLDIQSSSVVSIIYPVSITFLDDQSVFMITGWEGLTEVYDRCQ